MFENINNDVDALRMHLNELKTNFDRSIRDGIPFDRAKKIYLEIKDLECQIRVMELTSTRDVDPINDLRYKRIDEPPSI